MVGMENRRVPRNEPSITLMFGGQRWGEIYKGN